MAKRKRTLELNTTFDDEGFAEGFAWALRKCYQPALDISWEARVEDGAPVQRLTQGDPPCYAFRPGDVIFERREDATGSHEAGAAAIQMLEGTAPDADDADGGRTDGVVRYQLFPAGEIHSLSQRAFFELLRGAAKLPEAQGELLFS